DALQVRGERRALGPAVRHESASTRPVDPGERVLEHVVLALLERPFRAGVTIDAKTFERTGEDELRHPVVGVYDFVAARLQVAAGLLEDRVPLLQRVGERAEVEVVTHGTAGGAADDELAVLRPPEAERRQQMRRLHAM